MMGTNVFFRNVKSHSTLVPLKFKMNCTRNLSKLENYAIKKLDVHYSRILWVKFFSRILITY